MYIYIRDKHEHEPVPLLALSFLYGIMSVFLALAILFPLNKLISIDESSLVGQFIQAFIFVALIEEGCKFLFIRGILYRNKNFN